MKYPIFSQKINLNYYKPVFNFLSLIWVLVNYQLCLENTKINQHLCREMDKKRYGLEPLVRHGMVWHGVE